MKQKVVIIGHGYTSRLGMIRALGVCGYDITVIVITGYLKDGKTLNTKKPIDCYSKYVKDVYYCISDNEQLVKLLLSKCTSPQQKVVIIPDSDFSAAAVDLNQERLKEHFVFPHINHEQGAVVKWMDKSRQKNIAKEVGLNVAKCCVVNVKDGKYEVPDGIEYPCFPKPLITISGGKGGLRRCDNETNLCYVIDRIAQRWKNFSVLVEQYMQIETEYALLGFSDGNEVIMPGIIQILSLANGGHFGVARQGKVMSGDGFEDLIQKFRCLVKHIGFVGIFDIDFYKCGGEFYFGEVNFRYGGSGYAVTRMGVNLPQMIVRTLCGDSISGMNTTIIKSAIYVNERMCLDDWVQSYITTFEFLKMLRESEVHFVFDEEDPLPQKKFIIANWYLIANMKRIIRLLIKRVIG